MDILAYRSKHELSQAAFAARLTEAGSPASQSLVSQWEQELVQVPPARWKFIEQVTGGEVTRQDLRPDLFESADAATAATG